MNGLLIYKGVRIVKSIDELKEGDKVKILDGYDVFNRSIQMFSVGTIGKIIEVDMSRSRAPYIFRVEARDEHSCRLNRWWYTKKQVEPVEEEFNGV